MLHYKLVCYFELRIFFTQVFRGTSVDHNVLIVAPKVIVYQMKDYIYERSMINK